MKLKLPLLIKSQDVKYVLARGCGERITMVDTLTGNVYANHTDDKTAITFLECGTWEAVVDGTDIKLENLVRAVNAAKAELQAAEEALKKYKPLYLES